MNPAMDAGAPIPCPSQAALRRALEEGGWEPGGTGEFADLYRRPGAEIEISSSILDCVILVKIYQRV